VQITITKHLSIAFAVFTATTSFPIYSFADPVTDNTSSLATYETCSNPRAFPDRILQNVVPLYIDCGAKADAFITFMKNNEGRIKELLNEQQLSLYMQSYPKTIADEQHKDPAFGKNSITLWRELTKSPEWQFWYPKDHKAKDMQLSLHKELTISSFTQYKINSQNGLGLPPVAMVSQEEVNERTALDNQLIDADHSHDIHAFTKATGDISQSKRKWMDSHKEKYQYIQQLIKFTDNLNDLPSYYTPD